jgi:hypothetical protein
VGIAQKSGGDWEKKPIGAKPENKNAFPFASLISSTVYNRSGYSMV